LKITTRTVNKLQETADVNRQDCYTVKQRRIRKSTVSCQEVDGSIARQRPWRCSGQSADLGQSCCCTQPFLFFSTSGSSSQL